MSFEKWESGDCVLYRADCLEILPTLGKVDAVITDPPYGVKLGIRANNQRFNREQYRGFDDTPDFVRQTCVPAVVLAMEHAQRGLVTPGVKNMWLYPQPKHCGSIFYPCATGCNTWGFSCWQPMFYYGNDPYGGQGSRHDSFQSVESAEPNGHPCPKPIGQMVWMVERATVVGETVLDPFMGSGTTGVACVKLGRKFVGIEIDEGYFNIAKRRILKAQNDAPLFDKPKLKQATIQGATA